MTRCGWERQIDDREADEDNPRDGVLRRGMPALPPGRLLKHHPESPRHHLGHEQAQDRFLRQIQTGKRNEAKLYMARKKLDAKKTC